MRWSLVVMVLGVIGLVAYVVKLRSEYKQMKMQNEFEERKRNEVR